MKEVKQWVQTIKATLHGWTEKIRWVADVLDWFVNAIDSLPLPKDDEPKGNDTDNSQNQIG